MSLFLSITIYAATFSSSILCFKYAQNKKNRGFSSIVLFLAICIPCLTACFRTSGADYKTYISYYEIIHEIGFASGREPLWVVINLISPNKNVMLFLTAFVFLFFSSKSIYFFVNKNRTMSWSILLLVFYSTFLNIMRQMIAVSIIVYFLKYIFRKKPLIYLLGVIIASLFHKSSIVMIVVPIILFFANRVKYYELLIVIAMFIAPILVPVMFRLLNAIGLYAKYAHKITFNFEPQFILCMLPPTFLYYLTGGKKSHSYIVNNLFYLYLISFPLQTMGFMAKYLDRLTYNFYFVLFLFVPMVIDEISNFRVKRQALYAMYGWFLIYYIFVFIVAGTATVYPYIDYSKRK